MRELPINLRFPVLVLSSTYRQDNVYLSPARVAIFSFGTHDKFIDISEIKPLPTEPAGRGVIAELHLIFHRLNHAEGTVALALIQASRQGTMQRNEVQ